MRTLLLLTFTAACFAQTPAAYPSSYSLDNDTSTGTTFQKLAKMSAGKAVIAGTSPANPIGICVSNCGTSGPAIIAWAGTVGCVFDNTTTADHWAIPSSSVSGDCSDSGSTTKPKSGTVVVGQIKTISGGGAGTVSYVLMTLTPISGGSVVATGTSALGTSAISSGTCATAVTTSATGTLTTDAIAATFNADPTAVTGYSPTTSGMLTIIAYPTADNVNFKVCNNTSSSITPGAITLNWRVVR